MNRNVTHRIFLLALALLLASAGTLYAGKKPKITRHDATLLQNAIKISVEWQAEKPVVLLKATVGGQSNEVELDEFDDNTRDRHGFYGEADVSIALEPYEAFVQKDYIPYVIQIRDDFGRKSEITGRVKVKVQEAEDTYTEEGARYPGGMQGKPDDSGEYKTRHIIRDVLDIVEKHTARPRKGDSDDKPGQDPYLDAYSQGLFIQLVPGPDGQEDITARVDTKYEDPGAFVQNSEGKTIAELNQIVRHFYKYDEQNNEREVSKVDTKEEAVYKVTYDFQDSSGTAQQQFRYVYVVPSSAPAIILLPEDNSDVELEVGTAYQEPEHSYKVVDKDGITDITDEFEVLINVAVDTNIPGPYFVYYEIYENENLAARATRNVYVVDSSTPAIILLPEDNPHVTLKVGQSYVEPKPAYKVADKEGTTITDKVKVEIDDRAVDTNTVGKYEVYYYIYDYDHGVYVTWVARNVYVEDSTTPDDEEGIKSPPPEGLGAFGKSQPPGTTKGPRKPPSVVRWKGMPHTGPATRVTPPKKLPPGITVAPQSNKKPRLYYKAKLPPTGSTINKADSAKLPPGGITLKPGVASQPTTQPSDDKKKQDVKKMKPLR